MFLGLASRELWKGLLGELELTRITVLKPVPTKQILTVPSVDLISRHHPGWGRIGASEKSCSCTGGNSWLWTITAQVSLFLWAKIFPEWRRETKMIDRLEPSLISSLADSLVMCAPGWCAVEWQLIDSPGLGYREDETCLEHLTCCWCGTLKPSHLNPFWMQAPCARLGRCLAVLVLKAEDFFSLDNCQGTEFFAFLVEK